MHHDVNGRHGAGRVVLRAAPAGTGIIAGGPMRAVFESLGVHDVVAKSQGSSNPYNMIRATFDALAREDSPRFGRPAPQPQGLDLAVASTGRRSRRHRFVRGALDMTDSATVTVVQTGSAIGRPADQRADAEGPRPQQDRSSLDDQNTPAAQGMIAKVAHLVRVVEGQ